MIEFLPPGLSPRLSPRLYYARLPVDRCKHDVATHTRFGSVCFAAAQGRIEMAASSSSSSSPLVQVPMATLGSAGDMTCEAWHAAGKVTQGQRAGLYYAHDDALLFGAIQLNEDQFDVAAQALGKTSLQLAADNAYCSIFDGLAQLGFPHVLRFWNYIADINGASHGLERYRQFNNGRQEAFLHAARQLTDSVPAASAVGFAHGPLTVYFLASCSAAPVAIENPRQVSAYRYPQDYGPSSPTFSRASLTRLADRDILFLSGTASIVGHQTMHAGDAAAQTRETLVNIDAILEQANRIVSGPGFALHDLYYKVYVRHAEDVAVIQKVLREAIGNQPQVMYLRADICRADLLVEIEASAGHLTALA